MYHALPWRLRTRLDPLLRPSFERNPVVLRDETCAAILDYMRADLEAFLEEHGKPTDFWDLTPPCLPPASLQLPAIQRRGA